jgi:tetratricopeptide (TPR) repeat protein
MTWKRGHAVFAALSFFVPLLAYARTVTPTVPFWDSGEFIATSYILGLPHPPGNPVYTMLGRMMTLLPFASIAWRVNFMSSLASATACFFTFLFTSRAIRRTFGDAADTGHSWLASGAGGLVAALFLAFGSSFWDSAIEAEVYSLSSAIIAFVVWLSFEWWDRQGEPGNDKRLILIVYILGVSTGVHLGTILIAPSLLVLFALVNPGIFRSSKFIVPMAALSAFVVLVYLNGTLEIGLPSSLILGVGLLGLLYAVVQNRFFFRKNLVAWWVIAAVVGATVQIFLLIRSQQMPAVNEGAPTTLGTWLEYLSRKQYGPADPFDRRAELWYQIQHMYLRYVGQQWHLIERLGNLDLSSFWVRLVNAVPYLLFFTGAWWNYRRDKTTFWFFLATHIVMGPGLIFYLNFTDHEVRERDYFFTNSYHFIAVWMGMGSAAALHALARALAPAAVETPPPVPARTGPGGREVEPAALRVVAIEPVPTSLSNRVAIGIGALTLLGLALLPMRTGWFTHNRAGFYIAHDYAYNMLTPLAPGAVVFTNGDNDTFPLWYIQEVEKVRKDVRVVNLSLLNTPWYIEQLRDQEPKVPISFTNAQLAVMGPYQDPQTGNIIWVKDLAVKDILKTNQWRRPLYLAVTVPDQMGLEKQLSLEGLVFRIEPKETQKAVDLDKTMQNIYSVFKYGGLLDKNRAYDTTVYKDENAYRLVQNYTAAHVQAAYQLQLAKRNEEAVKVLEDAVKISPDFPGLLEYMGKMYEDTGRLDRAERIYLQGVQRFPTQPEYHYHLGILYYQSGRVEPGIAELRRAAELNQQYFDWFSALFTALWQTGRRAEAVDVLRTWVRAHPEDAQGAGYLRMYEESLRVLGSRPAPGDHMAPSRG